MSGRCAVRRRSPSSDASAARLGRLQTRDPAETLRLAAHHLARHFAQIGTRAELTAHPVGGEITRMTVDLDADALVRRARALREKAAAMTDSTARDELKLVAEECDKLAHEIRKWKANGGR
jgi:hypothetical protein